jgi:hypothetical protein
VRSGRFPYEWNEKRFLRKVRGKFINNTSSHLWLPGFFSFAEEKILSLDVNVAEFITNFA